MRYTHVIIIIINIKWLNEVWSIRSGQFFILPESQVEAGDCGRVRAQNFGVPILRGDIMWLQTVLITY